MLETVIEILQSVPWYWVLIIAFLTTLIENLFPPAPGDSILVFTGTLVGINVVDFPTLLIMATIGSVAGFLVMYLLGYNFGRKIFQSRYSRFISIDALIKTEKWFQKYGYFLIIANRFLSGTRAVISFFAGMSELSLWKTIVLSTLSAALWNFILIYLGSLFGDNWEVIDKYIKQYGTLLLILAVLIVIAFLIRYLITRRKHKKAKEEEESEV